MRWFCAVLALVAALGGCHTTAGIESGPAPIAKGPGSQPRPVLTINGQPFDGAMLNPDPPRYDDGAPAGDVIEGEFRIDITELTRDDRGTLTIRGTVRDAQSGEAVRAVQIEEVRDERRVQAVYAGINGEMEVVVQSRSGSKLVLSMIGYRSLALDLDRLARASARR